MNIKPFIFLNIAKNNKYKRFKGILIGKNIALLLRCKECSKTLKIKDVKETIIGDFKMCDKHLEMIKKSIIKLEMSIKGE